VADAILVVPGYGSGIGLDALSLGAEGFTGKGLPYIRLKVVADPSTYEGKTLTYVPVAQSEAGTTELAAADLTKKHKMLGCVLTMSVDGTLKFIDSSGDRTGAMDIAAKGGFVLPTGSMPMLETGAVNRSLSLVTTGGAAKGVVVLLTEA
jgi:hypothetical protein